MQSKYPIGKLIEERLREIGLNAQSLGLRLGYKNPAKAAGRVHALCWGHLDNPRSRSALTRLPAALELSADVVEEAVLRTRLTISNENRVARERERAEQEAREARWRANFRPHGVIVTERRIPGQITFCALTGGPEARLIIPFDVTRPMATFVAQAIAGLQNKAPVNSTGRRYVPFFGEPTGLMVNYSPDLAVHCDLDGSAIRWLSEAYRTGQIEVTIGSRVRSAQTMSHVVRLDETNLIALERQA